MQSFTNHISSMKVFPFLVLFSKNSNNCLRSFKVVLMIQMFRIFLKESSIRKQISETSIHDNKTLTEMSLTLYRKGSHNVSLSMLSILIVMVSLILIALSNGYRSISKISLQKTFSQYRHFIFLSHNLGVFPVFQYSQTLSSESLLEQEK